MKSIKNKFLFFALRILKDIIHPVTWSLSDDVSSQQLGEYYFRFQEKQMANQKGGQKSIVYDSEGIPVNPTYIDVRDKAFVYFPITIGQVGLAVFHTYLNTKSEKDKHRFLKFVDWFYENAEVSENLGVRWLTDVSLPQYKDPGHWQSAFSQSRGISILLRGYQVTHNKKYLDYAEKALIPFTKFVADGGVTSLTEWGPFYEEYTSDVPILVLNGMIFSLFGIYDYVRAVPDNSTAIQLFSDGIETLKKILPEYDIGYWSRYNLCKADWYPHIDPATIGYQKLHITQLTMMYKMTGENIFKEYADKFKKQINIFNAIRMYKTKYKALRKINRL